jgi:hypothetical protein
MHCTQFIIKPEVKKVIAKSKWEIGDFLMREIKPSMFSTGCVMLGPEITSK